MPKGGARPGAGRPRNLAKAVEQLNKIRDEMQRGFYASAFEMAKAMPTLVMEAIAHARGGDKQLLKFLIEQFYKIVAVLPSEEQPKYVLYHERLVDAINRSLTENMGAGSTRDAAHVRLDADPLDGGAVL